MNSERSDAVDESDPARYHAQRLRFLEAARARGANPYPHKFHVSVQLPAFVAKYLSALDPGQRLPEDRVSVAGRVVRKASSGAKLIFFDLRSDGAKIQAICDARNFISADLALLSGVKRGDIVGFEGYPGKSKRGELSIFACSLQVLAPCLHMLPGGQFPLTDQETRYRQRYLDLISNPHVSDIFRTRARIVSAVRRYLDDRGFLEVRAGVF